MDSIKMLFKLDNLVIVFKNIKCYVICYSINNWIVFKYYLMKIKELNKFVCFVN